MRKTFPAKMAKQMVNDHTSWSPDSIVINGVMDVMGPYKLICKWATVFFVTGFFNGKYI